MGRVSGIISRVAIYVRIRTKRPPPVRCLDLVPHTRLGVTIGRRIASGAATKDEGDVRQRIDLHASLFTYDKVCVGCVGERGWHPQLPCWAG